MFNIQGLILGLVMIVSISSCKSYEYTVSEPLIPYVEEYFQILEDNDIKFHKKDFTVQFDYSISSTIYAGLANGMFDKKVVNVSIHPEYWTMLNEKQRKILIFHELSHDMFDSLHNWDIFLMQPRMHDRFTANNINWDWAVDQLIKYIKDER
jgi:hypothetical protein